MKYILQIEGQNIEVEIKKSRRATLSIGIESNGSVMVKAPVQLSNQMIQAEIEKRAAWIWQKTREVNERQKNRLVHRFVEGEKYYYRGEEYTLRLQIEDSDVTMFGPRVEAQKSSKEILVHTSRAYARPDSVRRVLAEWYGNQAGVVILERVKYYAEKMNEPVGRISIRDQKTRWGSCSSKRNLNFNWRLIMAPPEELEYVVIHEMCHLKEMNHSPAFWTEVDRWMPEYKVRRRWLKEHGEELCL